MIIDFFTYINESTDEFISVEGDVKDMIEVGDSVYHYLFGFGTVQNVSKDSPSADIVFKNRNSKIRTDMGVLQIRKNKYEKVRWYKNRKLKYDWEN